jgi:hypothetical protein
MQVSIYTPSRLRSGGPWKSIQTLRNAKKECPDVSAEERPSSAFLKRIRKLRWIGMEEEAEKLQIVLADFTQWTGWLVDGLLRTDQVVAIPSVELAPIGGSFGQQLAIEKGG